MMTIFSAHIAMVAAVVSPEKLAKSDYPWIYLVGLLLAGMVAGAVKLYGDFKKDKKADIDASEARFNRMLQIDAEHRADSKEREKEAREHQRELMDVISDTTKEFDKITTAIKSVSDSQEKMSDTQEKMLQTQQQTVEAVQHLNNDFREMKKRMDQIERQNQKESA